jgi:transposase
VKAYASGAATREQLAEIFGYHIQSSGNWIREFEREGRLAPRPKGHRKSVFTEEEKILLRQLKLAHILNGKARLNPHSTPNLKLRCKF